MANRIVRYLEDVVLGRTNASPRWRSYAGNPDGLVGGIVGDGILSTDGLIYRCTVAHATAATWVAVPTSAGGPTYTPPTTATFPTAVTAGITSPVLTNRAGNADSKSNGVLMSCSAVATNNLYARLEAPITGGTAFVRKYGVQLTGSTAAPSWGVTGGDLGGTGFGIRDAGGSYLVFPATQYQNQPNIGAYASDWANNTTPGSVLKGFGGTNGYPPGSYHLPASESIKGMGIQVYAGGTFDLLVTKEDPTTAAGWYPFLEGELLSTWNLSGDLEPGLVFVCRGDAIGRLKMVVYDRQTV